MPSVVIPFVGPAYKARVSNLNAQECINWYVRGGGPEAKSPTVLYPTPGLTALVTLAAASKVRGMMADGSIIYAVCGTKLYTITTGGVATDRGTIPGSSPVSFAENGTQVFMANGTSTGYLYTKSTTTLSSVGGSYPGADQVVFLDGYFVVFQSATQKIYVSTLYDGATWDSLDFASAEINPDNVVGIAVDQRELMICGKRSTEFWYNTGGADYPLGRISGGITEYGCIARWSIATIADAKFWLTNYKTVVMAQQWQAKNIGTDALHEAIAEYSVVYDAEGFTYGQDGHYFYALTFPTEGVTWVFDLTTQAWHQRKSPSIGRFRASFACDLDGVTYVGDYTNGKIYTMSPTVYTEDTATVTRTRTTQVIANKNDRITMNDLIVDFEEGTDPSGTAVASLSWSDDGGHTYNTPIDQSLGVSGAYSQRVEWRGLAQFRERIFKLEVVAPIKIHVLGAYADVDGELE
jgi:hypothetical protein